VSRRAEARRRAPLERGAAERGGEAKRSPLKGAPSRSETAVQQKTRGVLFLALYAACGGANRGTTPTLPAEPKKTEAPVEEKDPWAGRADLIGAPPVLQPTAVTLPATTRFVLPNGLKVIVVSTHDLPVVSVRLAVTAGGNDEPPGKRALAGYAATMLTKGTQKRTATQIAEEIAGIGGDLDASADLETTYVSCQSLAKDAGTCLGTVADIAATPSFPQAEMATVAEGIIANLRYSRENPPALAAQHLENALWGDDHVRGWRPTEESVKSISRKDLQAWHRTRFVPANAILAVAGDVDPTALRPVLAKAFARWAAGKAPGRKTYPDPTVKGVTVRLVDKPDAVQSNILIGSLGVAHKDPDFIPAIVANDVLGNPGFSARLNKALRLEGGRTYGASSGFESWKGRGALQVRTATRNAETAATLKRMLDEIKKMHDEGPTAVELAEAKARLAGRYPMTFQNVADLATAFLVADLHELGEDWVRDFPLTVGAVTLEQARDAAKKHIDSENLVVIVVGKGDDVAPQLAQLGLTATRVGWLDPISQRERDKLAKRPGDPQKAAEGKKLLDAALSAKGGAAKLRAIKDIIAVGTVKMIIGKQIAEGKWRRMFIVPSRMRVDFDLPIGQMTLVSTEKGAWQRLGDQVQDLDRALADQAQAQIWREVDTILLRHLEPGTIVEATGKMKLPGDPQGYDSVSIRRTDGTNETRILIDPITKLIYALFYPVGGTPAVERYSDYRTVGGIKFAFRQQASGGQQVLDVTISDVKINGGVNAEIFDKK
jgi:zinc protease